MSVKYLLPCSCGENIAVESTQAGQEVQCSCGATAEVPTLHRLRQLEQVVVEDPRKAPPARGITVGVALLGLIILGIGTVLTYRTHARKPALVDIEYASPWESWLIWKDLQGGVRLPDYFESPYLEAKKVYRQYMVIGIATMILGVVVIAISAILALATKSRRQQAMSSAEP